jgi:hypothetical protein
MEQDRTILEAARAIRPYLPGLLVTKTDAERLDRDLAELLARSRRGEDVEGLVEASLRQRRATFNWTAGFLEMGRPPRMAAVDAERSEYAELPGAGDPTRADRFVCPEGDYVWYRRAVGQVAPACPTHGPLRPAPGD